MRKLKVLKFSDGDTVRMKDKNIIQTDMMVIGYASTNYQPLVRVVANGKQWDVFEVALELVPESSHGK